MSASVELFSTSILSNHKVRHRHERFTSVLTVKKIPFVYHDLASDDDAKSRWRRKARDPQIPGLLVNNEWRGTFEEFEESVEFGELDLFLRVDQGRAPAPAAATPAAAADAAKPAEAEAEEAIPELPSSKAGAPKHAAPVGLLQPRAVSAGGPAAAPSHPLPYAAPGTGKREEEDAEGIISALGAEDLDLDDADVDAMLAELSAMTLKKSSAAAAASPKVVETRDPKKKGLYPELGSGAPAVPRTYIPSANAGTAPLKLARMGSGSTTTPSRSASSASASSSGSSSGASSTSPRPARYNASLQSSKALTAEATAFAASRAVSSATLAKAVADGTDLDEALRATQRDNTTVGREDPELLLASLGLADLNLSAEEAEAFLTDGTIPQGMASGGAKLKRVGSVADRARDEAGAREVARRAKELGYGAARKSSESGSGGEKEVEKMESDATETETAAEEVAMEVKEEDAAASEEPTTPKLASTALPAEAAVDASPAKPSEEAVPSTTAVESEATATPEVPSSPKVDEPAATVADSASSAPEAIAKPLAEDEEPESTPRAKELALPPVYDAPPPITAPSESTSPIEPKRSTTPTSTSRTPFGVQSPTSASAERDAETDQAIALMLSGDAGGDLFASLDSTFDQQGEATGSNGKPAPLQLSSPVRLAGVEAVASPTSPSASGSGSGASSSPRSSAGASPASTPLPPTPDSAQSTLSKARSSSRIARPVVTPAPGARKGIDVQRRAGSSTSSSGGAGSSGFITPSHSAGSLGRTSSTSPSFASPGAGGPPRSSSATFSADGSGSGTGATPKKNRFSLAKFSGKDKKEKAAAAASAAAQPASPTYGSFNEDASSPASSRSAVSREERDQKSLSQILREADAAMAEFEEDDDAMSIMSRDDGLDWEE